MDRKLATLLRELRAEKKLTQQQLADMLFVDRSSVAHWEIGRRIPDAVILSRLAQCLDADVSDFLYAASLDECENYGGQDPSGGDRISSGPFYIKDVLVLDPKREALTHSLKVLKTVLPDHFVVSGFSDPDDALDFAGETSLCMAFIEVKAGTMDGLELSRSFARINPLTNLIFLTDDPGYALKAWDTSATGYILKPLKPEVLKKQFLKLKNPVAGL